MLQTRRAEVFGLPVDVVQGACAISGLFDLRPHGMQPTNVGSGHARAL